MKILIDIPNNSISGARVMIDGEEVSKGWTGTQTKKFISDIKGIVSPKKSGSYTEDE